MTKIETKILQEQVQTFRKKNGTDVLVWDEMVVVEFVAGYWNMNERLSTTKIHSVSIACVPANI